MESGCGKCGDATRHAVVAVVNGEVIKAQCMICGSTHKYKPTSRQAKADSPGISRRTRTASGVSTVRVTPPGAPKPKAKAAKPVRARRDWEEQIAKRDQSQARPYDMGECFAQDELVDHSKFGVGIVLKTTRPDKMDVLFQEGMKTLRCKVA